MRKIPTHSLYSLIAAVNAVLSPPTVVAAIFYKGYLYPIVKNSPIITMIEELEESLGVEINEG